MMFKKYQNRENIKGNDAWIITKYRENIMGIDVWEISSYRKNIVGNNVGLILKQRAMRQECELWKGIKFIKETKKHVCKCFP